MRSIMCALMVLTSPAIFGTIMYRHYDMFSDTIPSYLMFMVLLTNIRDLQLDVTFTKLYY